MKSPKISYLIDVRIQTLDPIICSKKQDETAIFDIFVQSINPNKKTNIDLISAHIEQSDFSKECTVFLTLEADEIPFKAIQKIVETYEDTSIQILYAGSQEGVPYPTHMGRWVYNSLDFAWKDDPIHVQAVSQDMKEQYPEIFSEIDLLFGTW